MRHVVGIVVLLLAGCASGPLAVRSIPARVISCGSEAAKDCAGGALPAVSACLDGTGDVTGCLLGLVQPAGCVTYGVIACLVRGERDAEHQRMALITSERALRATEFLEKTGAQFDDGR